MSQIDPQAPEQVGQRPTRLLIDEIAPAANGFSQRVIEFVETRRFGASVARKPDKKTDQWRSR
ncbi:MAG: hypothetical protein WBA57_26275 [Elainellaceae cyanobacterium]